MKNAITICLALLVALIPVIPVKADTVVSPLTEPIPSRVTNGSVDHLQEYVVAWSNAENTWILKDLEFDVPTGAAVEYYSSGKFAYIRTKSAITNYVETVYDVVTGSYISHREADTTTASGTWYRAPLYTPYFPNNEQNRFFITDSTITQSATAQYIVAPFVDWAEPPIDIKAYRAYMGEPTADPYNQYVIFGYGDSAKLLWISQRELKYYFDSTQNPSTNEVDGYWDETIAVDESGVQLAYMYMMPSALQGITYTTYIIQATVYDLETGEYETSQTYTGTSTGDTVSIDLSSMVPVSELSDITVYGLNALVDVDLRLSRSLITWNVDPSFDEWKSNVYDLLQRIYEALIQTGEEVTIEQPTDAISEVAQAENEMVITDNGGNVVNGADVASEVFSNASDDLENIGQPLGIISSFFGEITNGREVLLIPITLCLALGLMVTILGRKRS